MTGRSLGQVFRLLKAEYARHNAPIVEFIKIQTGSVFKVLVATILSARTKDQTTAGAATRLFKVVNSPADLRRIPVKQLERLIFPVGFYHTKAQHLKRLPDVLDAEFHGVIPDTVEELCRLPGVGRKTANLVVAVGFDKPAVCVDVHVHRICNRFGLVRTATPFDTEMELRRILPVTYWKTWNSYLVSFGQTVCLPVNPKCQGCPVHRYCKRVMVKRG
ncbi:MAG: endonuclease III [bacterium]